MGQSRQALISALGAAVQAFRRSTDALDDTVADQLGVNRTDLRCLDWLYEGPKTAGQLATATGLSSAATTSLVDRLEHKGFVRRVRDPSDRRRVLVEMTDEARRRGEQLYGPLVGEAGTRIARYGDDELAVIRDYFVASTELTERHRSRILQSRDANGD